MQELSAEEMQSRLNSRIIKTQAYCAEQNVEHAIELAKLAHQLVDEILADTKPGLRESQVRAAAEACFAKHGITELWHPPYVRFGANTLLTFQDKAKEDLVLQEDDIAFIDLGIVKHGIEGDAGRSITFGNDPVKEMLAAASRTIFERAREFWKSSDPTGIELYAFVHEQAAAMGLQWNLDPAGHLIGAFPHRGWSRGINHFPQAIEGGKWILEIQVRHPDLPMGSFFEDLLY